MAKPQRSSSASPRLALEMDNKTAASCFPANSSSSQSILTPELNKQASAGRFSVAPVMEKPGEMGSGVKKSPETGTCVDCVAPPVVWDDLRSPSTNSSESPAIPLIQIDRPSADRPENAVSDTMETLPNIDHYRNMDSVGGLCHSRPTLSQLHDEDFGEGAKEDADAVVFQMVDDLVSHKETKQHDEDHAHPCELRKEGSGDGVKFGWIQGVFVRCVLNILGVMLYLRLSWVSGQAGIGLGSVVILLSSLVTTVTAISMCAISTNGDVKGGGAYFMISRSLGPEFGGSIGLMFSFANAVGAAMYIVGFSETVRDVMKVNGAEIVDGSVNDIRIVSLVTVVALLGVVLIGVQFEAKAQLFLLGILSLSYASFVIGTFLPPDQDKAAKGISGFTWSTFSTNFMPGWRGETFFSVFSIFFPAATGIMAGANISGDLADPQKSIPQGTLLAILVTSGVYLSAIWLTGASCLRDAPGPLSFNNASALDYSCTFNLSCEYGLLNYFQIMEVESLWGPLVTAGVFAATLSSALSSLVSAPKVFQAVCKDRLFPYIEFFGQGFGKEEEPRRAYLLTFAIAVLMILIGNLNAIAPIISNFFLAAYALINYSCFDASFSGSLGFRPAFKFYNMWLSLFGAIVCVGVMFIINWWTALLTLAFILMLYVYILRRKPGTPFST